MSVGIAEHKPNGRKEVTLPGPIATNNHVMFGRKRLDHRLVFVATQPPCSSVTKLQYSCTVSVHSLPFKALDDNLFDIHLDRATRDATTLYHPEHPVVSQPSVFSESPLCVLLSFFVVPDYLQQHRLLRDQRLELMPSARRRKETRATRLRRR